MQTKKSYIILLFILVILAIFSLCNNKTKNNIKEEVKKRDSLKPNPGILYHDSSYNI